MKRTLLALALTGTLVFNAQAGARDDIAANPLLAGSNFTAYPDTDLPALSQAPEGYEPFYIATYARHGSRWLCGMNEYDAPITRLEQIARDGQLTPLGDSILQVLKEIRLDAVDRCGDLTDVGAEQHQRIARRMTENFPQVFAGQGKTIDCKSSTVMRCALSMLNQVMTLKGINPDLEITTDASGSDLWWVAWGATRDLGKLREQGRNDAQFFKEHNLDPTRFVAQLVVDPQYMPTNADRYNLMRDIFMVTTIQQSHKYGRNDLYNLFTNDEIFRLWQGENAQHYFEYAEAPQTHGLMPYAEVQLLRDFIARADSALLTPNHAADLRFGHETILMPLAVLMELGETTAHVDHPYFVSDHWQNYKIFPMAGNIQWIFYRPVDTDTSSNDWINATDRPVLVRALLNEHEMTMPVTAYSTLFYPWPALRNYYTNKMDTFEALYPRYVRHSLAD